MLTRTKMAERLWPAVGRSERVPAAARAPNRRVG